jgi:signal transduction histidine kinase/CheY-like chemotaxis protein
LAISEEASASSEIPGDLVHVRGSESWPTDDELVLGRRTEVTLSAVSGRQVTLEARATRAHFRGVPVELWFCRDLTAQKQIEARLMQADRLATLGTLAGGLAHAINNPLSSMVLNLEDLVRRMPELTEHPEHADDIKERLSLAKEAADRVARVVSQLRVFARMRHASDVEDVDVRRVVEDGIELVANEIRHRGQLKLALHPVPPVRGVEGRIEQALLTLLILAVRMLPDRPGRHSRLVVETGMDDGRVAVTVRCEGASAMTSSSGDTELSGSEGPWERSIGLAICDEIVRSMEGSLEATSDGTVSTFRVSVPVPGASDVRLGRSVAQTRSAPSEHGVRAKVLVIDDDPGVLSALRVMLQDDHDVTVVQDPREAIADVLGGASYDVVFCDFVMPQMTGEDVYDALRRGRPGFEQRIVFMTGAAFQREADRFLARVDNARIDKPFNLEHVERLVRRAVR